MSFPRELSVEEKEFFSWILPESNLAYKAYNQFALTSHAIGEGRWGTGNLLLDNKNSPIDTTLGMPPVIAYGEFLINNIPSSLSVHEYNIDDQLEVQFSGIFPIPDSPLISNKWCYSYWKPGDPCPATGSRLREIAIYNTKSIAIFVLAISAAKKVLWLHDVVSGFNQLIPVTAFYDELLRTKQIRDAALISRPATFFERIDNFSDTEYTLALLEYDKKASRKFESKDIMIGSEQQNKSFFQKLFSK
ncbi:MAG: hypothetical protein ABI778_11045 [Ignavibacteriota bacterium]